MAKIKVSEASGVVLDWLVAKCEGYSVFKSGAGPSAKIVYIPARKRTHYVYRPSTNWVQGGPIIEREKLQINPRFHSAGYTHPEGLWGWEAFVLGPTNIDGNFEQNGPTPLIAAMRCYVASKLGEIVEVPDGVL